MSQYKVGTVTTAASNQVTGAGTLWLTNASIGDIFCIQGENAPYYIANVNSDTLITLTQVYGGSALAGRSYFISRSFTLNQKFPYPEATDIDTHTIVKRALTQIDTLIGSAMGTSSQANRVVYTDANGNQKTIGTLLYDESALTARAPVTSNTNDTSGLIAADSVTPAKRVYMNFNTSADRGIIQATQSGVATKNLHLQPAGSKLIVGIPNSTQTLDVGDTGLSQSNYGVVSVGGFSGGMVVFGQNTTNRGQIYGNAGGVAIDTAQAQPLTIFYNGSEAAKFNNGAGFNPASTDAAALQLTSSFGGGLVFKDGTGRAGIWTKSSGAVMHLKAGGTSGGFTTDSGMVQISATGATVDGTLAVNGQLAVNAQAIYWEKSGTRSWTASVNQTSGVFYLTSGDGNGQINITSSAVTFAGSAAPSSDPTSLWSIDGTYSSTSNPNYKTLANNATLDLASGSGIVAVHCEDNGAPGIFITWAGQTNIISDPSGNYSTVLGTAGKTNLNYNVGTGKYRLENKSGGTLHYYITTIRTRANS